MALLVLDSLSFVDDLKGAGMPEGQARALSKQLRKVSLGGVATKGDIEALKGTVQGDIGELKDRIHGVQVFLMKWMTVMLLAQAGLVTTLVKLL